MLQQAHHGLKGGREGGGRGGREGGTLGHMKWV